MSRHGLGRAYIRLIGLLFTQCLLDGHGLAGIIERSSGTVGIYIYLFFSVIAGFLKGLFEGPCAALSLRIRSGYMICVAGGTVTRYLSVYLCASLYRMLIFFKY